MAWCWEGLGRVFNFLLWERKEQQVGLPVGLPARIGGGKHTCYRGSKVPEGPENSSSDFALFQMSF